jgi:hypothetical protein
MIRKQKSGQAVFNGLLVLLPLVPYSAVLPEVVNPVVFFILTILILKNGVRKLNPKAVFVIIVMILLCLASTFFSKDKVLSFMGSTGMFSAFAVYLSAGGFSREEMHSGIISIFYGGVLTSLVSIILNISGTVRRLQGTFNYANSSAIFFAVCAVIYFYMYERGTLSINKYLQRIGVLAVITALFLTQSRGGLAVYLLALIYMVIIKPEGREGRIFSILF